MNKTSDSASGVAAVQLPFVKSTIVFESPLWLSKNCKKSNQSVYRMDQGTFGNEVVASRQLNRQFAAALNRNKIISYFEHFFSKYLLESAEAAY